MTAAFTYRFFDRTLVSEVALPSMSAPKAQPGAAGAAANSGKAVEAVGVAGPPTAAGPAIGAGGVAGRAIAVDAAGPAIAVDEAAAVDAADTDGAAAGAQADDSDSPKDAPASSSPGQVKRTAIRNPAVPTPVRLIWDSEPPPDSPRTPITAGRPASFEAWRTPDGFLFTTATWSVAVPYDGDEVTVHGARNGEHASRIAHPLTNTILARLPALWGMFPMHAAALATPAGAVVISGASGAGKSTLSQWLVQHEGWALLDDDAIAIAPDASAVWGMGGVPRLWPDAASALGMAGTQLPGHPAGKLAVAAAPTASPVPGHPAGKLEVAATSAAATGVGAGDVARAGAGAGAATPATGAGAGAAAGSGARAGPATPAAATEVGAAAVSDPGRQAPVTTVASPPPLLGIIHLLVDRSLGDRTAADPLPATHTAADPANVMLQPLRAAESIRLTSRAVLSMELKDRAWLEARLQFCQHAAVKPNALLRYVKSEGSLDAVGQLVGQWVATLGQRPIG